MQWKAVRRRNRSNGVTDARETLYILELASPQSTRLLIKQPVGEATVEFVRVDSGTQLRPLASPPAPQLPTRASLPQSEGGGLQVKKSPSPSRSGAAAMVQCHGDVRPEVSEIPPRVGVDRSRSARGRRRSQSRSSDARLPPGVNKSQQVGQ